MAESSSDDETSNIDWDNKTDVGRTKDLVHKCHSDPGKVLAQRQNRQVVAPRKCLLTLDGYSYVIVASPPETKPLKTDTDDLRSTVAAIDDCEASGSSDTATAHQQAQDQSNQTKNGVSDQGALTIVRRSSGRKNPFVTGQQQVDFSQIDEQTQQYIYKKLAEQPIDDSDTYANDGTLELDSELITTCFDNQIAQELKRMQPRNNEELDNVDLTTENLPAVDTPDACDKAALRLRCLLRELSRGEISAEILQKNLHYAARVLEAVFIDETNQEGGNSGGGHADGKANDKSNTQDASRVNVAPQTHSGPTGPPPKSLFTRRRLRAPVWARRLADEDDELSEVQPDAVPPEVREWLASTFTRQLATTRRKTDEKPKFRSVAHAIRAGIFVDRIYRRVSSAALMQFPPEVVKVLKTLDEWSFDVFALADSAHGAPIKYLGYDLLNRYGIIHKFKVPPAILEVFLNRIEEGYCRYRNPYHNNLHGADVAQTVHHVLCQTGLMNWLTDLEIFATLLAALIHDYEHTGTTNNFHVMSSSDTAMLYNDRAVLENHHISAAFRVLKDDECNVLQNLSREEYRELRSLIIDMVLATDMSFHFQQLKNMRNLLTLAEPQIDKSKALSLVLHCCDISHPAKKWNVHHRWTMLLLEEFFRQGDLERELGLPFSPLCDRNNTLVAESQIGFIEFIVEPSMAVCSDMLEVILAPIAPIASNSSNSSKKPPSGDDSQGKNTLDVPGQQQAANNEAITSNEQSDANATKNGGGGAADDGTASPNRFRIRKPWIACLAENKKIWKEQAVKDAEAREAAAAAAAATAASETTEAGSTEPPAEE